MFKKNKLENAFQFNWGVQDDILDIKPIRKTVVGVDAGGTKTLVGHCDARQLEDLRAPFIRHQNLSGQERYVNNEYSSLNEIIQAYLSKYNIDPRDCILSIAGAGPVKGRTIHMSNRAWIIDADAVQKQFQFEKTFLINDLECMIYALRSVSPEDLLELNHGERNEFSPVAIIAAGTGLGESLGVYVSERGSHVALPGEGGNSDFAPGSDLEIDLYKYIKNLNNYVSWEDLVSGKGLVNIYRFLVQNGYEVNESTNTMMQTEDPAVVIAEAGVSRSDSTCRRTLEIFMSLYGAEAGNLALTCLPYGGLYITGGIAPKILPMFHEKFFMDRFLSKGKLKSVLDKIPVQVITNSHYGIIGAINYALLQQ